MANARDIRRRIKSVKNTAQITKAMQLVAASKMKKAQEQALAGRAYADLINKVLVNLKSAGDEAVHPLLEEREGDKELVIVITSDKGLCGALNTNLIKAVFENDTEFTSYVTSGRKGLQALGRAKKDLVADFPVKDPASFAECKTLAKFATDQFLENPDIARVKVAFTNFVTTLTQVPHVTTLLPVNPIQLGKKKDFEGMGEEDAGSEAPEASVGYEFEPSPAEVFDTTLPLYVNYQIYQMILEARASEHSSRMVAMKGASDNANQMIKDLTLEYNKLRQAAITNELLEITTAMRALE